MTLHVPTILLTSAMMSGLIAALQFFVSHRLQHLALRYWAAGNLLVAASGILLGLRPEFPLALSVVAGNGLIFAALGLTLCGVRVFDGRSPMLVPVLLAALLGAGLLWLSLHFGDNLGQRIVIASLVIAGWCGLASISLYQRPAQAQWTFARSACATLLLLLGLVHLGRAVAVAAGWIGVDEAFSGNGQAAIMLAGLAGSTSWSFCSLYMVLDRLASTDDLTGLLNRRTTLRRGRLLLDEAMLRRRAMSILMLDLDHFKSINDRFGHHVGDAVLRRFAEAAARSVRAGDVVGRLGGEEFCVLLPGADADAAREEGERLRQMAERELRRVAERPVNGTVTVGIATLPPGGQMERVLARLIRAADEALYLAKADGRNRVRAARWPFQTEGDTAQNDMRGPAQPAIRPL